MPPRLFFLLFCLLSAACAGRNTGLALGIGPRGPGLALYTDNLFLAPPYAGAHVSLPETGGLTGRYERGGTAPYGGVPGSAAPLAANAAPPPDPLPEKYNRESAVPCRELSPSPAGPPSLLVEPLGDVAFQPPPPVRAESQMP